MGAKEIYDPKFDFYIVPEGCQIDSTGRFWYSIGDLGNGVQEGEIVKALRIVIGVDDTQPDHLRFFPRTPCDWKKMSVEEYPVVFERSGQMAWTQLRYQLERAGDKMKLRISADQELGPVAMLLRPFARRSGVSSVRVNGKIPAETSVERSGDSWWVRFTAPVGPLDRSGD